MSPNNKPYVLIIIGNMIPLAGLVFLQWDMTKIFLFYGVELCAYELTMIPKIVVFCFNSDEYYIESAIKKAGISLSWLLYHFGFFIMTMMFLLHGAFAVSASSADFRKEDLYMFIGENIFIVIYIFGDYIYTFVKDYILLREHETLGSEFHLKEIAIFYFVILVALGIINGVSVGLSLDYVIYQVVILLLIIGIKTISQIILRKVKNKVYAKK